MKQKNSTIQQGVVTELITELAKLPEREKAPGDPVKLSEIFRTKEFIAEIKNALKRGYSFDDLAQIFSERCGVTITARQMKYHVTRWKNRGMKSKAAKQGGEIGVTEGHDLSADSPKNNSAKELGQPRCV